MTVYVDGPRWRMGRMRMCHMIADSTEELLAMADRIGVKRRWLQDGGTWREHFDISKGRRDRALAAGAVEIPSRELVRRLRDRKDRPTDTHPSQP